MTVSIFGTDGVRGPAGEGVLESSSVRALAAAFAQSLTAGDRRVALVRDTRESGTWLRDAVAEGLAAAGAQAVDLGVLPTPALSWWLASDGTASGGIAITASHNPWYDNGLKLFAADGTKVPDSLQASCEEHYRSRPSLPPAQTSGTPMLDESAAAEQGYVRSLSAGIEGALGGKTVVIDHASGAAWRVLPAALRGAGALPIGVAPAPPGRNINDNVGAVPPARAAEALGVPPPGAAQARAPPAGDAEAVLARAGAPSRHHVRTANPWAATATYAIYAPRAACMDGFTSIPSRLL